MSRSTCVEHEVEERGAADLFDRIVDGCRIDGGGVIGRRLFDKAAHLIRVAGWPGVESAPICPGLWIAARSDPSLE